MKLEMWKLERQVENMSKMQPEMTHLPSQFVKLPERVSKNNTQGTRV